jgi:NAD(P)-dependent dehydrogenase (short-subunit alcohol dehydrogenase family)
MTTITERFSLAGAVAIVTGGSRGIGLALSRGLADAGARVVVASRSEADCQAAVEGITDSGGTAVAVATDIASADDRAQLVTETMAAFGRLDILSNRITPSG